MRKVRFGFVGGLLLLLMYAPAVYAQAQMQKQLEQEQVNKAREAKPFDLGIGPSIGWSSDRFLYGWDVEIGKRLKNTENWGYGLQYHLLTSYINAVYMTATPLTKPVQFKLGVASVDYPNSNTEVGLGIGVAALNKSMFGSKVHLHLMDIEYIEMPHRSYFTFSISVGVIIEAMQEFH